MFAVRLCCNVTSSDGITTEWEKTIVLPFAPWIGLWIRDVSGDRDPHIVEEIEWQLETDTFMVICETEDWDDTVAAINEEMKREGWT